MASSSTFEPVKVKCHLTVHLKTMVLNVYDALINEHPGATIRSIVSKCSKMTGVGEATVYRLIKQRKSGTHVTPPMKSTGRKTIEIDSCVKNAIRRKVHSFFLRKELPTLDKLLREINEDDTFPKLKRNKLWKLLQELHFVWEKHNRHSVLIEKDEIICWRRQYLREMRKLRQQERNIFYLDETWVNEGHFVSKVWQDKRIKTANQAFTEGLSTGLKAPVGKGRRLIIVHIGGSKGFVDGGLLDFVSVSTKDYHEEMTADTFEEYFVQMIDLIPTNSIIVMDNASYHSRLKEPLPSSKWKKHDILDWLRSKDIAAEEGLLKKELLEISKLHSLTFKKYVVDEMAKERGLEVLRLPPYHCELNPIELIWAQVKGYVARNNRTFKLNDVRQLLCESISKVSEENWQKAINHVIKEEERLWKLDGLIEETIDPIVISMHSETSDEFESE